MMYQVLLIFALLNSINAVDFFSYERNMIRNIGLRFIISCKYKQYKLAIQTMNNKLQEKIDKISNNIKTKYNNWSYDYYSLSEDERFLIESVINLIY